MSFPRWPILFVWSAWTASWACAAIAAAHDGDACERCRQDAYLWRVQPAAAAIAVDPSTGRDLRNYPPHRDVNIRRMRLEIEIDDMERPTLRGRQTLEVEAFAGDGAAAFTLDARLLRITGVSSPGRRAAFEQGDSSVRITLDPPLPPGAWTDVVIDYTLDSPMKGLVWTTSHPAWPGRPPQIHSQGQPETNHYWFPCHDFPNQRSATELIVTVPAGFLASSNGRLVGREALTRSVDAPGGSTRLAAYERFHWVQDGPHVSYLVTLVVGKFDVVEVGPAIVAARAVPLPVYVPEGRADDARATYGRTREMVEHFSALLGEPYPWDRYAQLVVWNFAAGGMENTAATTMYDTALIGPEGRDDSDLEGLISHELGHQWFGDLVTCNSWEHIWLNEGWATYITALWREHAAGVDAYHASIRGNFDSVIANDRPAPGAPLGGPGMASKVYGDPWETFRRPANPYSKGASILHMLRSKVGDAAFFAGTRAYLARHRMRTVETSDFRRAIEEASGQSLEQFFRQWCFRPGIPRGRVTAEWIDARKVLRVECSQEQAIDGDCPAFEFELPFLAIDGRNRTAGVVTVRGRTGWAEVPLPREPEMVCVDPDMAVLAEWSIHQQLDGTTRPGRWVTQAIRGPTYASRVQALRAIRDAAQAGGLGDADAAARDAAKKVAWDQKAAPGLRAEAISALAAWGDAETIAALARSRTERFEAREAACAALAVAGAGNDARRTVAVANLARVMREDRSSRVKAAAVRALGDLRAVEHAPLVVAAARTESQDDRLRQAALAAMPSIGGRECLDAALDLTRVGVLSRTRPAAIQACVHLAGVERDRVLDRLREVLESGGDGERRAWVAAGQGLAELGDPRARDVLARARDAARDDDDRRFCEDWLQRLDRAISGG